MCSLGNSTQLYDSLDERGIFGTKIHGYIWWSHFPIQLKFRIWLISYTPIQNNFKKIKYGLWGRRRRTSILCRENKEQESQGKNQGERGTMDILFLLWKFYWTVANLQCWVNFCCIAKWLSYTHTEKYISYFFHVVYDWLFNIFPYALQ